jgi:hypothetical protein
VAGEVDVNDALDDWERATHGQEVPEEGLEGLVGHGQNKCTAQVMTVRQLAIALALVLTHSAEGAMCVSKAAARGASPGGTAGARVSMTIRQLPSLASMGVAPDVSEVRAAASGPISASMGARKAMKAKVG